ncbi:MAG: hypothetical protein MJZ86_01740 [Bacteroidales bacterium]|nr:hypothetical protein [Bacteroidales bacterium]
MLKIFRTDVYTQSVIILIVSLAMWMGVFIHPQPIPIDGGGPIFYWLTSHLSMRAGAIIAYLLVIFQAVLLNSLLYQYKIIPQNTMMPALFYVLAMSVGSPTLTPMILGNTLLILAISQMMITSTLLSLTIDKTFGAASLMSLATIFCPAMMVFYVPLIFNMFNYSLYNWRDWTMLILGILAPYILVETYYYMTGEMFYRNYLLFYEMTDIDIKFTHTVTNWAMSVAFILILLLGLVAISVNTQSSTVNLQKNTTTIMVFIIGGILYTMYSHLVPIETQSFSVPFACCATALFVESRRKEAGANICFLIIIAACIIYNIL